jgi:hypothetical protein
MKSKAAHSLLAVLVFGGAMIGGYSLIQHLADLFGWKTPPAGNLAEVPDEKFGPLTITDPENPVEPVAVAEVKVEEPVTDPAEAAPEATTDLVAETAEPVAEPEVAEPAGRRTPVSDAPLELFSSNVERSVPEVNPNILNPTPAAFDNAPTPIADDPAGDNSGENAATPPTVVETPPAPPEPVAEANANLAVEVDLPVARLEVAAGTQEGQVRQPTLLGNALAGSVSGLIGGLGGGGDTSSRVQVRNDNRVVISAGGVRIGGNLPRAELPALPSVGVNAASPVAGAVANRVVRPLAPAAASGIVPSAAGAKAQLNLPAVGINAGTSGLGIQAGSLNLRVNTGLR